MSKVVNEDNLRERKVLSEEQLNEVILELVKYLSVHDDNKVKKHKLLRMVKGLRDDVDRLDVMTEETTVMNDYQQKIYIPVNSEDIEPFDIRITMVMDEMNVGGETLPGITHSFGLMLMNNYIVDSTLKPICYYINPELRKIMENITVNVVKIDTKYYLEIDLIKQEADIRFIKGYINIRNKKGYVKVEAPASMAGATRPKQHTIELFPTTGFDDIPERNSLVRSSTIKRYEVISEEEYENLEDAGSLVDTTMYSIPEEGGING